MDRHLHIAALSAGCNAFGVLMVMVLVVTATGIAMTPAAALASAAVGFAAGWALSAWNVRLHRRRYEIALARSQGLPAVDDAAVEIVAGETRVRGQAKELAA